MEDIYTKIFPIIKSIISDCICRTAVFLKGKIPEVLLNSLANEYTDKVLNSLKEKIDKK